MPARGAELPSGGAELVEIGKHIYRTGMLASGQPVVASGRADLALQGKSVACVNCHRRSGLGSSEGGTVVRPITGPVLFEVQNLANPGQVQAQVNQPDTRPVYTEKTLLRALRDGVDSAGRPLDRLMPRYKISDAEFSPLVSYLQTLSAVSAPGVTDAEIHLATVVVEGVDLRHRQEMLNILDTYIRDKNGETRQEPRRAREALHSRELMYQGYRKWVLHVWDLKGASTSWGAQLETYYRQQPVFAVLGGLSTGAWAPVHEFCETLEIPCLFPQIDLPVQSDTAFYSLYFSRGIDLEAEVLAAHLREYPAAASVKSVVQIYRNDVRGVAAANALRRAISSFEGVSVVDVTIGVGEKLSRPFWEQVLLKAQPAVLVLWLNRADLDDFQNMTSVSLHTERVYLSGGYLREHLPDDWRVQAPGYVIYPYELPGLLSARLARMHAWLNTKKIPLSNAILQANTYFTVTLVAEALRHIRNNFSCEYFIERIESMAETMPSVSGFHNVSLGPDQRFAVKGGYVLKYGSKHELEWDTSEWIVP